ncbi:thioesterase II family protein [Streptomyces bullii]|uniref:Thioesterase II family protein n=1 Tax=Streptomyces bullii TaxID=349910 RepID=A0ABW0USF6_9ACTN
MPVYDLTPKPRGEPCLTLVLLHHAGGSSRGYAPFVPHVPREWRVLGADLPGRLLDRGGRRCHTVRQAVAHLRQVLRPELAGRYAVFGHSMGALLAFELARELEAEGRGPCWLGVSGSPAPRACGAARRAGRLGDWPAHRVLEYVHSLGGTPAGTGGHRALAQLVAHTVRQDFLLVDGYEYVDGPPLRSALSVFGGADDPLAPAHLLDQWSAHARHPLAPHIWPGGHFYLFDHAEEVCARLVAGCRAQLTAGGV